jgi:CRP/FNR family transcriptional regulator
MAKQNTAQIVVDRRVPAPAPTPAPGERMFAWIERIAEYQIVPRGTSLHGPEQENDAIFLIQRGRVEFSHLNGDGTPRRWSTLHPGDFFGELRLKPSPGQPYAAQALEDCVLWKLDRARLLQVFAHRPEALGEIISIIGHKQDLLFCFKN